MGSHMFWQTSSRHHLLTLKSLLVCALKCDNNILFTEDAPITFLGDQAEIIVTHLYGPSPIKAIRASGSLSMILFPTCLFQMPKFEHII